MKIKSKEEEILKEILLKSGFESPAKDFTSLLIREISPSHSVAKEISKPIFSLKIRYFIASLVASLFVGLTYLIIISENASQSYTSSYSIYINKINEMINQIKTNDFIVVIPFILLSVLLLMLLDRSILKIFKKGWETVN